MKTKIFYFSTTGNSLAFAREIAKGLGDCELISITKVLHDDINVKEARLGFVFPVYAWGIPPMMVNFLKKLKLDQSQYIFAVATCGGTPGSSLLQLQDIIRKAGGDLKAGFVVKEGANTVTEDPGFVKVMRRISGIEFLSGKKRLEEILSVVRLEKTHKSETSSFIANLIGSSMNKLSSLAAESFKKSDKNFKVDEKCTGCRTCERVCPAANIHMTGNKPVWTHNCIVCNACIQWCPQQAIHIANETCRYRNPEIKAEDLMLR